MVKKAPTTQSTFAMDRGDKPTVKDAEPVTPKEEPKQAELFEEQDEPYQGESVLVSPELIAQYEAERVQNEALFAERRKLYEEGEEQRKAMRAEPKPPPEDVSKRKEPSRDE